MTTQYSVERCLALDHANGTREHWFPKVLNSGKSCKRKKIRFVWNNLFFYTVIEEQLTLL
jgi:hypothetical protein